MFEKKRKDAGHDVYNKVPTQLLHPPFVVGNFMHNGYVCRYMLVVLYSSMVTIPCG